VPYPTPRDRYADQTYIDNMFGAQDVWIMTDKQILVRPLLGYEGVCVYVTHIESKCCLVKESI